MKFLSNISSLRPQHSQAEGGGRFIGCFDVSCKCSRFRYTRIRSVKIPSRLFRIRSVKISSRLIRIRSRFRRFKMFVRKLLGVASDKKFLGSAEGLNPTEVDPCFAGHYGFPKNSIAVAFDRVQGIFAIATKDGRIKLFGANEEQVLLNPQNSSSCKFLQFLENEGILLNVTLEGNIEVWDIDKMELCHVYQCKSISAFSVLKRSPFMYIGNAHGDVFVLKFDKEIRQIICMQYSIPKSITYDFVDERSQDASVVCVLPQPSNEFNRVLVAYQSGLLILWGIQENMILGAFCTVESQIKKSTNAGSNGARDSDKNREENGKLKEISSVCWVCCKGSRVAIGFADGDIWLLGVSKRKASGKPDVKDLGSFNIQFLLISEVNMLDGKAKVPVFSLAWYPGNGEGGQLYICGGGNIDSVNVIRIINLGDLGTENKHSFHELEIVLPDAIKVISIISTLYAKSQGCTEILLILTKTGQMYFYSLSNIERKLVGDENKKQLELKPSLIKPIFSDSSISVAKIINIESSHLVAQFNSSSMQVLPSAMKLSPKEKHPADTRLPMIRSLYITGHINGSVNIWDVSCASLFLLFRIEARNDVEATVNGCCITAIDFSPSSGLLSVGDQLGMVQIFSVLSEKESISTLSGNHQGLTKIGTLKLQKGCITCISIAEKSSHIAVGCEEGSVALINIKPFAVVFNNCFFTGSSASIVSFQFKTFNLVGSEKSILFATAKDASVLAIDSNSGECLNSFILKPKHQSTALSMHILDSSLHTDSEIKSEKQSSLTSADHLEPNEKSQSIASDLMLLCAETCLWIYSASGITQGVKNVYFKERFKTKCCWAATFRNSKDLYALLLLFANGEIEIRSLPNLSILRATTLSNSSLCKLQISTGLLSSIALAENGRLVMVDADQEQFLISLLKEDDEYRSSRCKIQVYNKKFQNLQKSSITQESKNGKKLSADQKIVEPDQTTKKKGFKSFMNVKNNKAKNRFANDHESTEKESPMLSVLELTEIFSTRNFSATSTLKTDTSSKPHEELLDIDDLDIEDDMHMHPISESGVVINRKSVLGNLQRKIIAKMKPRAGHKTNEMLKETEQPDGARLRTIDEIKSAYGQSYQKDTSVFVQAKEKLMQNKMKLQGINDRAGEMAEDAKSFQSAAEELLKLVQEKNKR